MDNAASLPSIRRARGYRLYGQNGRRYLDLYQDNGRAITGHRPARTILEIKNLLSKGQIAAYPSVYTAQAQKALMTLVPGAVEARIYSSFERCLAAVCMHSGVNVTFGDIVDPALPGQGSGVVAYWRPFLDMAEVDVPVLIPVLPIATPPSASALVFREQPGAGVPESDTCSPVSVAAIKRSVYDLLAYINECDQSRWQRFDAYGFWSRRGPYLTLNVDESEFSVLYADLLDHGVVISPHFPGPSIIPGEYSPGELAYLDGNFAEA